MYIKGHFNNALFIRVGLNVKAVSARSVYAAVSSSLLEWSKDGMTGLRPNRISNGPRLLRVLVRMSVRTTTKSKVCS